MSQYINGRQPSRLPTANRPITPNQLSTPTSHSPKILNRSPVSPSSFSQRGGDKKERIIEHPISLLIKHDIIAASAQKQNLLHRLTAFLNVVLSGKFDSLLQNTLSSRLLGSQYSTSFFNPANLTNSVFTKEEILNVLMQMDISNENREEDFLDSLIEICTPEKTNFSENDDLLELTSSAKEFLYEFDIEESPPLLMEIAQQLEALQNNPHVATSDEMKKRVLDMLKDSEDKDEVEGMRFDYAEISDV